MKKLFMVAYINTGKRVVLEGAGASPYFEDKQQAKACRDDINKGYDTPFVKVSYGPDHWKYNKGAH